MDAMELQYRTGQVGNFSKGPQTLYIFGKFIFIGIINGYEYFYLNVTTFHLMEVNIVKHIYQLL